MLGWIPWRLNWNESFDLARCCKESRGTIDVQMHSEIYPFFSDLRKCRMDIYSYRSKKDNPIQPCR